MKHILLHSINFIFFIGVVLFVYSCASETRLEDCDCDVYPFTDTYRVARVDTIAQVDTVYKKVGEESIYYVQIGAFYNKSNAEKFALQAKSDLYLQVYIISTKDNIYRVTVGDKTKEIEQARIRLFQVKAKGYLDAFIRDQYGPVEK